MSRNMRLPAIAAVICLLMSGAAHAAAFDDADIETSCYLGVGPTPAGPSVAGVGTPTSFCTAGGQADLDGRFSLNLDIETPGGGLVPGQGSAYLDALFRVHPVLEGGLHRAVFDVSIRLDAAHVVAHRSYEALETFHGSISFHVLAAHTGCFECIRILAVPLLEGVGSVVRLERRLRIVMATENGSDLPSGELVFWLYPYIEVYGPAGAAGSMHVEATGSVGPVVRVA